MMSLMLPTTQVTLAGGQILTVSALPFDESIKVYGKFQKLIAGFTDQDRTGLSTFMVAGLAGALSGDDLDFYIKAFAATTMVDFNDGRTLPLKKVPASKNGPAIDPFTELFGSNLEELFVWLDACANHNFGTIIAKMRAAIAQQGEAAKAQPTQD